MGHIGQIRVKEDSATKPKLMVGLVSAFHKMPNPQEKAEQKDNYYLKYFHNPSVFAEGFFIFEE